MPFPEGSIHDMLERPDFLHSIAYACAESLLRDCRTYGHAWDSYSRAAVERRAEKDIQSDIRSDDRLHYEHSDDEVAQYRERYTAAFVAGYYDAELRAKITAQFARGGTMIVCMR